MTDRDELRKIVDAIRATINSWGPLPTEPAEFVDTESFSDVCPGTEAFLVKTGDQVKVRAANIGDLKITYDDLVGEGGRIGIGRDFLIMLQNRLSTFKDLLDITSEQQICFH
jgi:hypothetical protein